MDNRTKILHDLKAHLQSKLSEDIKEVILFGSQASSVSSKNDSDYDIVILLKSKPDWKRKRMISDLCYDIDLKYNIITDTHVLSEKELNTLRGKQPIFQNAIDNGIHA